MKTGLPPLLPTLFLAVGIGIAFSCHRYSPIPDPRPAGALFTSTPPQPAGAVEEALTYQTTPLPYPPQGIVLRVEGDMILAHANKTFSLPPQYVPPGLISLSERIKTVGAESAREAILLDLQALFTEAEVACGCRLAVLSAYRSYQTQAITYNFWISKMGYAAADRGSARPGHSEHQLGTTVDISSSTVGYKLTRDFGNTCEGKWLEQNAHRFGFVLSYPQGKEATTGYAWEPWHFRWIGKGAANEVRTLDITLEEYLSMK